MFVFGDLQDTPDNSKIWHYGLHPIVKHPLGIVCTCEEFGLTCSIFQHIEEMENPIDSWHGSKGVSFIDGMYTSSFGLPNILGISIIQDSGIHSDHDLGSTWESSNIKSIKTKKNNFTLKALCTFQSSWNQVIWLPTMETNNEYDDTATLNKPPPPSKSPIPESQQELYRLWSQSIENSFRETKSHACSNQSQYIFEDLGLLQRNIQDTKERSGLTLLRQLFIDYNRWKPIPPKKNHLEKAIYRQS
jgi:hypothetical protein